MEPKNELYPLSAVMDKILIKYEIKSTPEKLMRLRKAVERFCKETNIWDTHKIQRGKREDHFFAEEELRMIVYSQKIHDYVIKNLLEPEQSKRIKRLEDEADKLTEIQQQAWTDMEMEDTLNSGYHTVVSPEEVRSKKLEIMIEALFLRYFTPVDMEKLKEDMEEVAYSDSGDIWPETIAAMERLADGRNYYKEKPTSPKLDK